MSPSYPDEAALIRGCLSGDQDAWNELVGRYGRLVYSIARRYGTVPEAEDIFQNVFVITLKQLPTLRNPAALMSWLARITHHEARRFHNSGSHEVELAETTVDGNPGPVELVLFRESQLAVLDALSRLEPRCRQLLTSLFVESDKPSYEEISARLNMPLGSIGPTQKRCLEKLAAILKAMGYGEDSDEKSD